MTELGLQIDREPTAKLRTGAFRLFVDGKYLAVLELVAGLSILGKQTADLLLLSALCLNELGHEQEAEAVFCEVERGLLRAARKEESEAILATAEMALGSCRRFMPGGKDSQQERTKLARAARRFQPRLPKENA